MRIFIWPIVIFINMTLSACASQDHANRLHSAVDRDNLIISMTYTQRQLLNILLNSPLNEQNESLHKRRGLMLSSHCDLIRRNIVHAATDYPACHDSQQDNRFCISDFHQCIAKCPSFKRDCPPCEQQALQCLTKRP